MSRFDILMGRQPKPKPEPQPKPPSLKETVAKLSGLGYSVSSVERCFGLKVGLISRMLKREKERKHIPAAFKALFRMIDKFPDLISLAEAGFDSEKAKRIEAVILLKSAPDEQLPALKEKLIQNLSFSINPRRLYEDMVNGRL